MKRLRPARLIVALATAFILAGTAGIPSTRSAVTDGFHLIGTDAAYVRFVAPVDACHGFDLFVGYVQADGLQSPIGGGRPHFHSDVDATMTVNQNAETEGCGSNALHLVGGRGVIASDQVEIVALESATLDGFELTLAGVEGDDTATVVLILDLAWTTLMQLDLIDAYQLMIVPVALGSGERFFKDGHDPTTLSLTDVRTTGTGIVMLTYQRPQNDRDRSASAGAISGDWWRRRRQLGNEQS